MDARREENETNQVLLILLIIFTPRIYHQSMKTPFYTSFLRNQTNKILLKMQNLQIY